MVAKIPRVIYLSSTSLGKELLGYLQQYPIELVLVNTDNTKITEFPDYDLGISFLYTHRIPSSEFKTPYKWVNFHPGPLPEYRGRNIAYHAIMQKSPHFGSTIHYMDVDFDTGEIIDVIRFPIESGHTAGDLVALSYKALADLFVKYIPQLLQSKVPSFPQFKDGTYYRKSAINEYIDLTEQEQLEIRALTVAGRFYAKTQIGEREYVIMPIEDAKHAINQ